MITSTSAFQIWISAKRAIKDFGMPRGLLAKLEQQGELQSISDRIGRKHYPLASLLKTATLGCRKVAIYTPILRSHEDFILLFRKTKESGLDPVLDIPEIDPAETPLSDRKGFITALEYRAKGEIVGIVAMLDSVRQPPFALVWMRALQMAQFWVAAYDPKFERLDVYPEPYPNTIRLI
jgi:hypothetical protein